MNKSKFLLFALNIILFFGLFEPLYGQQKYWVTIGCQEFNLDKSEEACERLSLQQAKDSLRQLGISVLLQSKWLHSLSVMLEGEQFSVLNQQLYVKEIIPITNLQVLSVGNVVDYWQSYALSQIKAAAFIEHGLSGKGVKVGIIDGGFLEADQNEYLKHSIEAGRVMMYKDYISPQRKNPYEGYRLHHDNHGTQVWQMIAGYKSEGNRYFGLASAADFYLMRTDHGKRENRAEEDYLVHALETLDSMGVKLVNVSLGYARGYDDKSENHHPSEVDGSSSMLTKAIGIAAKEKGMLIILSAGNEGNDKNWKVLSLPADAPSALSVGATMLADWAKAGYSSIGPENLGIVKPEVSCFASNGTSFAAPVITGLAAAIWEYDTTLSNIEIKEIICKSAHLYHAPNNFIGYGVPDAQRILNLLQKKDSIANNFQLIYADSSSVVIDLPASVDIFAAPRAVLFHKKDKINVAEQEIVRIKDSAFSVVNKSNSVYTTLTIQELVYEIVWPNNE